MNERAARALQKRVQTFRTKKAQPPKPPSPKIEEYIQTRIEGQQSWYERKASFNKKHFQNIQKSIMVLGTLIPMVVVVFQLPVLKSVQYLQGLFTAGIATGIAILAVLDKIGNYQAQWYNYRITEEMLKKERSLFDHNAGHYAHIPTQQEKERVLVEKVENIIASDLSRFMSHQEQQDPLEDFDWEALFEDDDEGNVKP